MNPVATYQSILKLSTQMAEEALRQNWENLVQLQAQRERLFADLPRKTVAQSASERETLRNLIQQIQQHDASIMDYVTPWREQVGQLISKLSAAT